MHHANIRPDYVYTPTPTHQINTQYWERDCLAVAAVLDAITTNHLSAMTHPDWLPLLGMTALPTLPRPRQRLTMPTMVKAQRPGPLFLADDGDVDVTSLYGETGVGEVCQLLEALRGYYSPVVGRVCGRVDDAMVDALLRLTRGDGQEAFATEGAVYRGHERLALCRPVLDAFATAGYRCMGWGVSLGGECGGVSLGG